MVFARSSFALRPRRLALASSLFGLGLYALIPRIHADSDAVDPDTGIVFPRTLRVPSQFKIPPLELVGLGVRTVSFLGIQVYSVAFYADLSSPALQISRTMSAEDKIDHIVRNTACLLRIIPTRGTSYTHLRDAFLRALQGRLVAGQKQGTITQDDAQAVAGPMRALKTLFPNTALAKHASLDLYIPAPVSGQPRPLIARDLGAVQNTWVATELFLYYFAGAGASPKLRTTTVARLEAFETA
ncbi:chalcone-flavanone isomerase-domain-containing protein [Mycena belliarum]|uniref:Chalcone-flavanone isomerase-domain-containing protein n=1 Tax=Mycena belliarum TaxID=1033014 RepID=A0AAD6XVE4_9AGAR|nr:chalcone-flavanone isomerase-domain-containing protein [Mycena belliae]